MSLELLPFPAVGPRFGLWCDDESLAIESSTRDSFTVSGKVEHVFPLGTTLHFRANGEETEVPLALGSRGPEALRALSRALPRGIYVRAESNDDATTLKFAETFVPAARRPRVQVLTTDSRQRVRLLDTNQLEVVGAAQSRCFVTLLVDTRRSTFALGEGTSAADAARAIAKACPSGFRAEVDGSVVTFWKGSDSDQVAA